MIVKVPLTPHLRCRIQPSVTELHPQLRDLRVRRSAAVGVEAEEGRYVSCARIFWTAASPPTRKQSNALLVYVKRCNDTYWRSVDTTSNMWVWGVLSIRTDIPSKQVATVQNTQEIVIRCKVLTSVLHNIDGEWSAIVRARVYTSVWTCKLIAQLLDILLSEAKLEWLLLTTIKHTYLRKHVTIQIYI